MDSLNQLGKRFPEPIREEMPENRYPPREFHSLLDMLLLPDYTEIISLKSYLQLLLNMTCVTFTANVSLASFKRIPLTNMFCFQLLKDFEVESRMNIRFMNMDTTTLCK